MDIFISYRRSNGIELARSINNALREREYYSFFDVDSIQEGAFPDHIFQSLDKTFNFLLLLSPRSLDRCSSPEDWVRREVARALDLKRNIIPIACQGFIFPPELPDDIKRIADIQAIEYNGIDFEEMIDKIIFRLKAEDGKPLRIKKAQSASNTFYQQGPMDENEKKRIQADYQSCRSIEEPVFDKLLKGKSNVILFNPAIYEINSYMSKYDRDEIASVVGLLNHQEDVDEANNTYATRNHQINSFYRGNMEDDSFGDEMDRILSERGLIGFDFVDLSLILRDCSNPEEKLMQVVARVKPGGIIYVRELDHAMAIPYPDEQGLFKKMISLIKRDKYSGDFEAGRKVFMWMKNADISDIHFEARQLSTVGMKRKDRRLLFETLFSYVEREYRKIYEEEPSYEVKIAIEWIEENYKSLQNTFISDDFFFSTGFMIFYGIVE